MRSPARASPRRASTAISSAPTSAARSGFPKSTRAPTRRSSSSTGSPAMRRRARPARSASFPPTAHAQWRFQRPVDARTRQPIVLKDPLNIGIVGNVIPKSRAQQRGARVPQLRAPPQHQQRDFQFRHHRRQRHFHPEELSGPRRSHAFPARTRSPAAICSTTPTKRERPSGATTSATTSAGRRTSPSRGRGLSAPRSSTSCAAAGTGSTKPRCSAPPTIPATTWSAKWACRWFRACRKSTVRRRFR